MPNLKPIVDAMDTTLMLNNSIAVSELFSASDPDGDPITQFVVSDGSSNPGSGFFIFQGEVQANGTELTIDAADIDDLLYVGGPLVFNESITIQAFDGTLLSDPVVITAYTAREESVRPIAIVENTSLLANETIAASEFISAFDPDGFPILSYFLRDRNVDRSFFSLDGVEIEQGVFRSFSAAQFARLEYNAVGRSNEQIDVFAYDGSINSNFATGNFNTLANLNRPVVNFASAISIEDELTPIADLVNTFDADGNTIKSVQLRDRNDKSFSGSLVFRGEELAARQFHSFTLEELDEVFFRGGERSITEEVRVRVLDGRFRSATNSIEFENTAGSDSQRPALRADNLDMSVESHLEMIAISDLITLANDSTNVVSYEIIDTNIDNRSGNLFLDGALLQPGQIHTITPQQFAGDPFDPIAGLNVETGAFENRSLDEIFIRADNGTLKGDWTRLNLRSEPEFFNSLFSGATWTNIIQGPIELTFSFMQQFPDYNTGEAEDNPNAMPFPRPFTQFTENQRQAARRAFDLLETYANLTFTEVSDTSTDPISGGRGGTYRLGNYSVEGPPPLGPSTAAAFAFFPSFAPSGGDIWINDWFQDIENHDEGTPEFTTLLHELGHTLGFNHTFVDPGGEDQRPVLPDTTSTDLFTVMSAFGRDDNISPSSFQLYDIYQIQQLYGVNTNHATGDDLYSIDTFVQGGLSALSIWDAGGNDTLSAAGSAQNATVDLRAGGFSSIGSLRDNISIAFGAVIENATGSDNDDLLLGNEVRNTILGGQGRDTLRGYGANDYLSGGAGADTYQITVADGDDTINENQAGGRDRLEVLQFPGLDDFTEDISFRLDGRDLVVRLSLDGGPADTTVTIENQTRGAFRVESLVFGDTTVDLVNLTSQATGANQSFQITEESTIFGSLVVPV